MGIDLKGKQLEAFCNALRNAFPVWPDLDAMVEFELGERLDGIVARDRIEVVILELVRWARKESRVDELLGGALRRKPRDVELRRIAYELALSSDAPPSAGLEALVMPSVGFASAARWRDEMAAAERRVCRIELRDGGSDWRGVGTGSLIAPDIVLTNAHVAELLRSGGSGRAQFDYAQDAAGRERTGRAAALAPSWLLAHSPVEELDYALIRLADRAGDDIVEPDRRRTWLAPERHDFVSGEPLFILQHPSADRLKLAVGSVTDLQAKPRRVRYSTNTEPGSSGSPCFTMGWKLVGLHQAADGTVNRGIPITAILEHLGTSQVLHLINTPVSPPTQPPEQLEATRTPVSPGTLRIFMSYHRRGDEADLASRLHHALVSHGHDVFIDVEMPVGTDWAKEIQRNIAECDVFIVLVSQASIAREMVQAEVREAYRRQRRQQAPRILPIRVRYDGPLDYEMECYLGRLHYARWDGHDDDGRVIDHIMRAIGSPVPALADADPGRTGRVLSPPDGRPMPTMDPRYLNALGGTMGIDDPLYIRRTADEDAERLARSNGQTMIIKGARQRGKSSLLVRYLAACRSQNKTIGLIDFQTFSGVEIETYHDFLTSLATSILDVFEIARTDEPVIRKQPDMTKFLQQAVLSAVPGPVVIAFDEVDRVSPRPYREDFFTMLRSWHNRRANPVTPVWSNLDLALVISTEPEMLIKGADRSPFNVGQRIDVDCLTQEQCHEMNQRMPRQLAAHDVDELFEQLGGHPYLTRLAYNRVLAGALQLPIDPRSARDPHGPFGDHLRAVLSKLSATPELLDALQQIIRERSAAPDLVHRLRSAGLVRTDGGTIRPSNLLYTTFFRAVK